MDVWRSLRVSVFGLGKLGLPLATCLATKFEVIAVDVDRDKTASIDSGFSPIKEPKLQDLLDNMVFRNRIQATNDGEYAVLQSDVTFIVVPTPSNPDGSFSSKHVEEACATIGSALKNKATFHVVVVVSTVIPFTCERVLKTLLEITSEKKCGVDFGLCYNPFLIALGSVIDNILNPDFVMIGESDTKSGEIVESIHKSICKSDTKIMRTSLINAEIAKIALNSYITMKISFANTLGQICEKIPTADVDVVSEILGSDSRIGHKYLKAGLGYGGPCFPRDNRAFKYFASSLACQSLLPEATDAVNDSQVDRVWFKVRKLVPFNATVAVLGLAYKPNTDNIEESQGVKIVQSLARFNRVKVYDPKAMSNARKVLGALVQYTKSAKDCVKDADLVIIATPWKQFENLNCSCPVIDCWRIVKHEHV